MSMLTNPDESARSRAISDSLRKYLYRLLLEQIGRHVLYVRQNERDEVDEFAISR